jgi:hypothetical protein
MAQEPDEGKDDARARPRVAKGRPEGATSGEQQREVPSRWPGAAPDAAPWARVVVQSADGRRQVTWLLGQAPPDLAVVDALARLQLASRRRGDRVLLEEVAKRLDELLELAGLRGEFEWDAEGREEPIDVEEGMDPGDPVP